MNALSDPRDAAPSPALQGQSEPGAAGAHATNLRRAADRLSRLFELEAPDAPGLAFVGGVADPAAYGLSADFPRANVSGRGMTSEAAFAGCVGEAVEYLSQLAWGNEPTPEPAIRLPGDAMGSAATRMFTARLEAMGGAADRWTTAYSLTRRTTAQVPADLCWRRPAPSAGPGPLTGLGAGCAAGASSAQATLNGLLELVERDAAALWWVGGRRPRPLAAEVVQEGSAALLPRLRRGRQSRRTGFLDITTDVEVPCVAAVSFDAANRGFACGLAARESLEAAVAAATLELCQMELANYLVTVKLARGGPGALAPVELPRRRRMEEIDPDRCLLVSPLGAPAPALPPAAPETVDAQIDRIVSRLASLDIECFALDMTRAAIGIPAVRVLAPCLQSLPASAATPRMQRAIAETGGGEMYTNGIGLL